MRHRSLTKALLLLVLLVGVVEGAEKRGKIPGHMRFSEYTGYDAFDWEVSVGALADTSYKIPVYRGWPSRPYAVIGDVRHQDQQKIWRDGEIRDSVKAAQAVGGDAIIIRQGSEAGVRAITGTANTGGILFSRAETTALIIRWQSDLEIQIRRKRDQSLLDQFKHSYPNLGVSEETGSIGVKYLLRSGVQDTSPDFFPRFVELMKRVQSTNDSLSGQWLFKAVLRTSGLVSQNERTFMGLATVKADRESMAIISLEGETEVNFSGLEANGRLNGQIGISGYSAKAEGVAVGKKISLTFQSTTQNGTVQGTFVLQR
jgi:hypothetical protein